MISTAETARRLGITQRRVQQLINAGKLRATKIAGIWLVDPKQIPDYRPPPKGRPRKS